MASCDLSLCWLCSLSMRPGNTRRVCRGAFCSADAKGFCSVSRFSKGSGWVGGADGWSTAMGGGGDKSSSNRPGEWPQFWLHDSASVFWWNGIWLSPWWLFIQQTRERPQFWLHDSASFPWWNGIWLSLWWINTILSWEVLVWIFLRGDAAFRCLGNSWQGWGSPLTFPGTCPAPSEASVLGWFSNSLQCIQYRKHSQT